jgi:hypothetical protein
VAVVLRRAIGLLASRPDGGAWSGVVTQVHAPFRVHELQFEADGSAWLRGYTQLRRLSAARLAASRPPAASPAATASTCSSTRPCATPAATAPSPRPVPECPLIEAPIGIEPAYTASQAGADTG